MPSNPIPIITIDGPAAAGKGTVAKHLASVLGFHYLDSGALYRVTALSSLIQNIPWDQESAVANVASTLNVLFLDKTVLLKGQDVCALIRTPTISQGATKIAAFPMVRQALLSKQLAFVQEPGLVADGRDMGSIVFPQALLKIFLTAELTVRVHRRYLERALEDDKVSLSQIEAELTRRDAQDYSRTVAPLQHAPDSLVLDTSTLSIEQSVNQIVDWYRAKCQNT